MTKISRAGALTPRANPDVVVTPRRMSVGESRCGELCVPFGFLALVVNLSSRPSLKVARTKAPAR
jgi:hypothetical protein